METPYQEIEMQQDGSRCDDSSADKHASMESLPMELLLMIVEFVPSVVDAGRMAVVSQGCSHAVEEVMRNRYASMWRDVSVEAGSEEDPSLPAGMRSWVRVIASRHGLLPPDECLLDRMVTVEVGSGEELEGHVLASGFAESTASFDDFGIREELLRGIYEYGLENPSPLQRCAIGPLVAKNNILAQAPTGMDKTATYAIGLLQNIDPKEVYCQALILVPCRELACAVGKVFSSLCDYLGVTTMVCMGGRSIRDEIKELRNGGIQLVVGTPTRCLDLVRRRALLIRRVHQLVVDDADELLSRGFQDFVYQIFRALPLTVSVSIFTATVPTDVLQLASNMLRGTQFACGFACQS